MRWLNHPSVLTCNRFVGAAAVELLTVVLLPIEYQRKISSKKVVPADQIGH